MAVRGATPALRMRGLSALALLALLAASLAATPGAAVDPRARAAPLATGAPILGLAVADNGVILAGTEDPGATAVIPGTSDPDASTWHIWNAAGTGLQSGSSDMADCADRLGDVCTTDAVAAAVSGDGTRFVIGANPATSLMDETRGLLLLGQTAAGVKLRYPLANPVQFVGMDRTGSRIAVVERVMGFGGETTTQVEAFSYDGSALTALFTEPYPIPASASSLAVGEEGHRFAVGADKHYRFLFSSSTPSPAPGITGTVASVAISAVGTSVSMAGYSTGQIAFFSDLSPASPVFSQKPASAAITAAAIQPKATEPLAVAGDAAGNLHIFQLKASGDPLGALVRTMPLASSAPGLLRFSTDGSTLLALTATDAYLLQARGGDLTLLWKDPVAADDGDLSGSGDLVALATDTGVRVYDAVHKVTGSATPTTGLPGQSYTVQATYRNEGTRAEQVTLAVVQPAAWTATVEPATLSLDPDASATVTVQVPVPASSPPGPAALSLRHTLASGGSGTTPLALTVAPVVEVALRSDGAASQAINAGATIQFKAKVENRGNQALDTAVRAAVDLPGWAAVVTPNQVRIDPGTNQSVAVTLTAANGAKEGDRGHVQLYVAAKPDDVLHLYGTVGARFAVAVSAPNSVSVGPGNVTTVEVSVQNKGNTVDSFDVQLLDVPVGWTAILDGGGSLVQLLDIDPGATTKVSVSLRAPANAEPGQQFRLQAQAISQGRPEVHAERPILVSVGQPMETSTTETPGLGLPLLALALGAAAIAHGSTRRRI